MKSLIKILLLTIIVSLAVNIVCVAQNPGDRIKAKRIAFFTDKLQLTPDEAQKFWPVFNEYDQKKNAFTIEKRRLTESFQTTPTMSEAEVDKIISKFLHISQQETQLVEQYNKIFRAILPARKVMKLYLAEKEFLVILLRELQANSR